jgi:hypothetical protein
MGDTGGVKIRVTNHNDLMELHRAPPRRTPGATVGSRKAGERKPLPSTDGRRQRIKGRDRQINIAVTQEIWDLVDDCVGRYDMTKNDFAEHAFRHYAAHRKAGGEINGG